MERFIPLVVGVPLGIAAAAVGCLVGSIAISDMPHVSSAAERLLVRCATGGLGIAMLTVGIGTILLSVVACRQK